MKQIPSDIQETAQMDVIALVRKHCAACEHVIIPPDGENEPDIFRCKVSAGKHCIVAINSMRCVKNLV